MQIETYFLYAIEIRQLGHLPTDWSPANNLWPGISRCGFSDIFSRKQYDVFLCIYKDCFQYYFQF